MQNASFVRRHWVWIAGAVGAGILALSIGFGGFWYVVVLLAALTWAGLGIWWIRGTRGRRAISEHLRRGQPGDPPRD